MTLLRTHYEQMNPALNDSGANVRSALAAARGAQVHWSAVPLKQRLVVVRAVRHQLASRAQALGEAIAAVCARSAAEAILSEVLPLADACRFLERVGPRLLRPRRASVRLRPLWLTGQRLTIHREPLGTVLIIGPSNYPLMLPGVQTMQALAAGNAVLLKPAPGCGVIAELFRTCAAAAGLPRDLLQVLDEAPRSAADAIAFGVDKVVVTGSAETGRNVLMDSAERFTPVIAELSGCDAAIVRHDADVDLAARALCFGIRYNAGATCIAPRRVLAHRDIAAALEDRLQALLSGQRPVSSDAAMRERLGDLIARASATGARLIHGTSESDGRGPWILRGGRDTLRLMHGDLFAPVMAMMPVSSDAEAIEVANDCPYGLGATIFTRDGRAAVHMAGQLRAGCVMINDMTVPSADPRVPFGGRGKSGFGVTRGAEGLLEMTVVKVVIERRGGRRPHYLPLDDRHSAAAAGMVGCFHGKGWALRAQKAWRVLCGWRAMVKELGHDD